MLEVVMVSKFCIQYDILILNIKKKIIYGFSFYFLGQAMNNKVYALAPM